MTASKIRLRASDMWVWRTRYNPRHPAEHRGADLRHQLLAAVRLRAERLDRLESLAPDAALVACGVCEFVEECRVILLAGAEQADRRHPDDVARPRIPRFVQLLDCRAIGHPVTMRSHSSIGSFVRVSCNADSGRPLPYACDRLKTFEYRTSSMGF